ncbi:MAG: hypothetical protein NC238_17950 [Dehalobacter sp.]|nr:hypothetical protein [Dehalobacter sp.]
MSFNQPHTITLKIDGPGINEGVNLFKTISILSEFHSILDKSYSVLNGKQKLTKQDREQYFIRAYDFKQGSFIVNADIIITGIQLSLPLLGFVNPYTIWEYARYSFAFLKAVLASSKSGNQPMISVGDNSQVVVLIGDGSTMTLPDKRILDLANRTRRNYANLAGNLKEGSIHSIEVTAQSSIGENISLSLPEKDLFESNTTVMPRPVTFLADVYDFNKEINTGKLRVFREQEIPDGDYPFTIIGNQDNSKFIESMLYSSVKITALEERELHPVEGLRLIRFQVIEVEIS